MNLILVLDLLARGRVEAVLHMMRAAGLSFVVAGCSHPTAIIVARANCGVPQIVGDSVQYAGKPELMVNYARTAIDARARVIGGYCSMSCVHIEARPGTLASPPVEANAGDNRSWHRARKSA